MFAEVEDQVVALKARSGSRPGSGSTIAEECASLQSTLEQTQADAKARRDELRMVLEVTNEIYQ